MRRELLERIETVKYNIEHARITNDAAEKQVQKLVLSGHSTDAGILRRGISERQIHLNEDARELNELITAMDELTAIRIRFETDRLMQAAQNDLNAALTKYDAQINEYRNYLESFHAAHP
jgi:hypothetical protein